MAHKPARSKYSILYQLCQLIPSYLVAKLARQHGVDDKARTFSPWSHVVALLYAQLAHALSLNDVCDALRTHASKLGLIRGAVAPAKNTLSHANRNRNAAMAEALFWEVLDHLRQRHPRFGGRNYKAMPRRLRRAVHAVDSTTIALVANCIDWARHRRKKAAAKLHLRLDLESFLPRIAIIDTAKHHDDTKAWELCAGLGAGEIVVFDKAYVDFTHLFALDQRGVFWVTRAKDNMAWRCVKRGKVPEGGKILREDLVVLATPQSREKYPRRFRRIHALVEVDGEEREMTFITNNLEWAASSICELYQCRWSIEVFFKEIKQTLQLCDFLGHNKNAILWQVWMGLLLYVLMRALSFLGQWQFGFKRLFCLLRSNVWELYGVGLLMKFCGTARAAPTQGWLPGFEPH